MRAANQKMFFCCAWKRAGRDATTTNLLLRWASTNRLKAAGTSDLAGFPEVIMHNTKVLTPRVPLVEFVENGDLSEC